MNSKAEDHSLAPALSLTLERVIAAPRALVFHLWTDGDHMRRWCAPSGFMVVDGSADLRPGGEWATTLRDPTGREWRLRGAYREVVPGHRLVFSQAQVDEAGAVGPATVVTIELADGTGGRTRLVLHQAPFAGVEARDRHAGGWGETLDSLAAYVARLDTGQAPTLH